MSLQELHGLACSTFSILLMVGSVAKSLTIDFIGVTFRLFQSVASVTGSVNQILNSHVHMEKFHEMEKNKISVDVIYEHVESYISIHN